MREIAALTLVKYMAFDGIFTFIVTKNFSLFQFLIFLRFRRLVPRFRLLPHFLGKLLNSEKILRKSGKHAAWSNFAFV